MSLRNRLVLPVLLSALAVLAACGGSSNPTVTPPPSGGFADGNLSGTYVFSLTGTLADSTNDLIAMSGTFTADGKGNISVGVIDAFSTGGTLAAEALVTSGTYNVGADGRPTGSPNSPTGLIILNTSSNVFTFDYVLTSSEHGLVTEFDNIGSASGTLDLQTAVSQSNIDGQTFAFNFSGSSGLNTVICGVPTSAAIPLPYATVGNFVVDGTGNISSGLEDFNNNCSSSGGSVTGGTVSLSTTPGTATITTASVTYSFDVFPIDATHLKFIETDALPIAVGDVFTQSSGSFPSGNNVFTFAGFDNNANIQGPFTAAGVLNTDASGNITGSSAEDINDAGVITAEVSSGIGGTYTAQGTGRWVVFFTSGFINGNNGTACSGISGTCTFAAYPSSGGLQLLEIDNAGVTDGTAYAQTNATLTSGQGYGMNLSGISFSSNTSEDDIAEFTNTNGTLSPGIIDFNDQGSPSFKNTFQASYAADSSVPGRGVVTPGNNGYLLTTYSVDSTTTVAVSTDTNFLGLGTLVQQNATAKSNAAATHLSVLRASKPAIPRSKRILKRQSN